MKINFPLLALAVGAFGIGTTEFVSMGLLNYIADDFGISEAQAGHVVTAYAILRSLGVEIGKMDYLGSN